MVFSQIAENYIGWIMQFLAAILEMQFVAAILEIIFFQKTFEDCNPLFINEE